MGGRLGAGPESRSIRARHPRADGLRECARAGEVLAVPVGTVRPAEGDMTVRQHTGLRAVGPW